jgi:Domain of unknown function (DUF4335)
MSLPNSIVRRYTPPTCTLEIAAKDSPLSRWVGQPVLKHLRFQLSFDDPRLSDDQWVKVQGDRAELEALYDVVTNYVQQFLNQSTQILQQSRRPPAPSLPSGSATAEGSEPNVYARLGILAPLLDAPPDSAADNPSEVSLHPQGLLSHVLHLGALANETSGGAIRLSAVQLADLATALDQYRSDVTAIPNLNRPSWVNASPAWARIAAVGLIFVGVSTSLLRLFEPIPIAQVTSPTNSQGTSSNDQRLAVKPFSGPSPSTSPLAFPPASPLVVKPISPTLGQKGLPTPNVLSAQSPGKFPTVAVPQKAPLTPAKQDELQIKSPLPSQVEGMPVPPLVASEPGVARERQSAPAASAPAPASKIQSADSAERSAASGNSTVFDTMPQVAEVRTYFKTNWQPVEGLSENLDYSLILGADGAVQQIIPLTKISEDFRDRVKMPPEGTPFLSPIKNGGNLRIRLVLSPDGKVQTFPESSSGQ